jgi:hypothetical protein
MALIRLSSLRSGRISKTKVAAVVTAATGFAIAMGWIDIGEEQRTALELLVVAVIALFLRDGIDERNNNDSAASDAAKGG